MTPRQAAPPAPPRKVQTLVVAQRGGRLRIRMCPHILTFAARTGREASLACAAPCRVIVIPQGNTIQMRILCAALAWGALLPAFPQAIPQPGDWPAYGRDPGGVRYSPLDQINPKNVATLERAWTYHTRERGRSFESTPIFVDNVLYLSTHTQKVIALDPETGGEIWRYDAKAPGRENRGASYWPGDSREPARILFGTGDGRLIAVSAKTGARVAGFGDNGVVNLRAGITDQFQI